MSEHGPPTRVRSTVLPRKAVLTACHVQPGTVGYDACHAEDRAAIARLTRERDALRQRVRQHEDVWERLLARLDAALKEPA